MKYYIISTKEQYIHNSYGDVIGCCKPSSILCIVEKEEIAKDFCKNNLGYTYEEVEVEETENNICATCKLNNQCPLDHKPNLQCPYDDYEKR